MPGESENICIWQNQDLIVPGTTEGWKLSSGEKSPTRSWWLERILTNMGKLLHKASAISGWENIVLDGQALSMGSVPTGGGQRGVPGDKDGLPWVETLSANSKKHPVTHWLWVAERLGRSNRQPQETIFSTKITWWQRPEVKIMGIKCGLSKGAKHKVTEIILNQRDPGCWNDEVCLTLRPDSEVTQIVIILCGFLTLRSSAGHLLSHSQIHTGQKRREFI